MVTGVPVLSLPNVHLCRHVCIFTSCLLLPCVSQSKLGENDSLCPHLCRYVHVYTCMYIVMFLVWDS